MLHSVLHIGLHRR